MEDNRQKQGIKTDMIIANPDPLGLFGFAFATFLGNAVTLGFYGGTSGQLIFECMFLGGIMQLIAGLKDYQNRNTRPWTRMVMRRLTLARLSVKVAPAVGFEPTTKRLTAARSTTELRRNA